MSDLSIQFSLQGHTKTCTHMLFERVSAAMGVWGCVCVSASSQEAAPWGGGELPST